jgi:hypothetical protein
MGRNDLTQQQAVQGAVVGALQAMCTVAVNMLYAESGAHLRVPHLSLQVASSKSGVAFQTATSLV